MNFMNRKMFKTRPARDKLNKMGGIMASSQPLMQTVQKFQAGGGVDPYYGRMSQPGFPAIRPGSVASKVGQVPSQIMNFIDRANRESGIGQIMQQNQMARAGVSPEDLARVSAATSATQIADQTEARREASASPTMRGPTASQAQMGQNLSMFEQMVEAGANPTMRGPTAGDVRADQTSGRPERPGQLDTAGVETLRGPTAEDVRTRPSTLEDRRGTLDEQTERMRKGYGSSLINAAESDDPAAAAQAGQQVADNVKNVLEDPNVSEEDKNETALEFLGLKDPGEKLSKKEQIEKNKEFYREVFGADPEKDKKIDGYNLAMMGFMIASGDSPNALQNIARGAAQGVKGFMKTAEKRQNREDKLTELAVREYENTLKSEKADEQFRMNYNLKVQELQDRRDQAETKAEKERFNNILRFLDDDAYKLAYIQLDKAGVDIGTDEGFKQLNDLRTSIYASQPDLLKSTTDYEAMPRREEFVLKGVNTALDPDKGYEVRARIAAQNNIEPEQVSESMITNYFGGLYDSVVSQRASGAGAGAAPAQISTREEYDALPSGASYIDPQGNRGVKR